MQACMSASITSVSLFVAVGVAVAVVDQDPLHRLCPCLLLLLFVVAIPLFNQDQVRPHHCHCVWLLQLCLVLFLCQT